MNQPNYKKFAFKSIGDSRGQLVSLECQHDIPFDIKRVYYIFDTQPNVIRGQHAHKKLEQVLIAINGKCTLRLDDGRHKHEIILDSRDEGLYIGNNIWREMLRFSYDCVLLVLASEIYNESDYIRNYDDFLKTLLVDSAQVQYASGN